MFLKSYLSKIVHNWCENETFHLSTQLRLFFLVFSSIWLPKFSSFLSAHYHLHLMGSREENKCGVNLKSVICLFPGTFGQKLVKDVNINAVRLGVIWEFHSSGFCHFPFPISKVNWEVNESWNDIVPLVYLKWFQWMRNLIFPGHIYVKLQNQLLYS